MPTNYSHYNIASGNPWVLDYECSSIHKTWHNSFGEHRDIYNRQATQHGCLPSLLGDGDKEIEIVLGEEIFLYWATKAAKAEQKSLVLAQQALPRKDPFLYSLTPHSSQFQQSAGATHF